jgi:23S rRNA A2030 N6-methylase RlmJ
MSKGRYRSVECKQVNWQQLIERASGQALVFAVDVAKEAFFGLLQVKGGAGLVRIRWSHPVETGELLSGLQRLMEALPLQAVTTSRGSVLALLHFVG